LKSEELIVEKTILNVVDFGVEPGYFGIEGFVLLFHGLGVLLNHE
jgi:hypothetical protein